MVKRNPVLQHIPTLRALLFYVKVNLEASKRSTKMGSGLPVLPSLVVNIADFIQHITNGYFQSTVHRVINKTGEERYSMSIFYAYYDEAELEVLPSCREEGKEYANVRVGDCTSLQDFTFPNQASGQGAGCECQFRTMYLLDNVEKT